MVDQPPSPLRRFTDWVIAEALPRWAADGFDADAGRFHERLDFAGRPLAVPLRSMVQARQIFVFADAAARGWFPDGAALAETAMASLRRDWAEDAGDGTSFAFSIDPASGRIASPVRDAYGHAFVLFAIAAVVRLNCDPALLALADRTLRFIDEQLVDPLHGGLFDAAPAETDGKRQNPLMHLLEALLFLEDAAPGQGYAERADRLVALFERRLLDRRHDVLPEYFARDWSPHPDPARAGMWEPGHHFEWAWLLDRHAAITGGSASPSATRLYDQALAHGRAETGLLVDEVQAATLVPSKRSTRLWPHTEAIKAAGVRARAGDADAARFGEEMADGLLTHFLDTPFGGGWIDHRDPDGHPLVDYVPASSLYHLMLAATEARRCFPAAAAVEPA